MKVILSLFMALSCLFLFGSCKLGQSKYIHPAGRLPVARSSHTATLLKDGTILLVGGNIEIPYTNALQYGAQLYDPTTGKVEDLPPIRCPRIHHTTTLLPDGKVLIYGGTFSHLYGNKVKHDDCLRNVIEIYEPRTRKFDSLESSPKLSLPSIITGAGHEIAHRPRKSSYLVILFETEEQLFALQLSFQANE